MLHKMAEKIAETLIAYGADEKKKAVFAYGAECFLSEIITNGIIFVLALILQIVPQVLMWLVFFTALRVNIGGYHENTHLKCTIASTFWCVAESYAAKYLSIPLGVEILLFIIMIVITVLLAPVIHPNHPISDVRKQKIRRISIWMVVGECILLLILRAVSCWESLQMAAFLAIFTAVLFAVLGKFQNQKCS